MYRYFRLYPQDLLFVRGMVRQNPKRLAAFRDLFLDRLS